MLHRLRLHLTALYLCATLTLVALVSGGAYTVLAYYFRSTIDLALQHRMAHEFQQLQAVVPPDLVAADLAWYANRQRILPRWPGPTPSDPNAQAAEAAQAVGDTATDVTFEDLYDGELAAIIVLPLDVNGNIIGEPHPERSPLAPNTAAVAAARLHGSDIRSVILSNGSHLRVLTYRVARPQGPMFLQLVRMLSDQDRALRHLMIGLLTLGGVSALLIGAVSWWLAGRSLRPARQAWERQVAFVANASHELRTPLAVMRASAEVTLRTLQPDDQDRRGLLGDLITECDHMSRLVGDLLMLSRLDAGQLALEQSRIAVGELLIDLGRQVRPLVDTQGVTLIVGSVDGYAWGDPSRLRQVILIVLDNALQHTPAGGLIRLEAEVQPRSIRVAVTDTGSGIAPEHLPHVFERFYRSERSRERAGGAGLGLAIARALIEAQHGQITIDSQTAVGTRVIVTLPAVVS